MAAEPQSFVFGQMEIAYDGERWKLEAGSESRITMIPAAALATASSPVSITRALSDGIDGCGALARLELGEDLYQKPTTSPTEISGLPAIRFTAHTRYRNATPEGVAICTYRAGSAYLLTMTIAGCRSGGRLGGPDPIQELTQGIRFVP